MSNQPGAFGKSKPAPMLNLLTDESDAGKMDIVPSPIVSYSKQDVIRAARSCPIRELEDCVNVVVVMSAITAEGVLTRRANLVVTHHTQHKETKEQNVEGSWEVKGIPVTVGDEPHLFTIAWPPEAA